MRMGHWLSAVLLVAASLAACAAEAGPPADRGAKKPRFEISKETTFVTGPVRADGTIDYVAAINAELSKGVTAGNNAAIPMLRAVRMLKPDDMKAHYALVWAALGEAEPRFPEPGPEMNPADADVLDKTLSGAWTAAMHPRAAKRLDSLKAELDLLVEASRRDRYYMPLVRERDDDPLASVLLPHLNYSRQLTNALKSRALLCLGNEDIDGFARDSMALVRLGRLQTHSATLVGSLVAMSSEAMGLDAIQIAASGGWLPEKDAEKLLAGMRAAPERRPVAASFEGGERGFMLEFLQMTAVHGFGKTREMLKMVGWNNVMNAPSLANNAEKDWNQAMRKANAWYDRLVEAGGKPTFDERMKAAHGVARDVAELKSRIEGWQSAFAPIEDRLIVLVMPSVERIYSAEARTLANERLTETALALSAFRTKLGEYPPRLNLLSPAYFKSEPIDPFTDKPLMYKTVGAGYELKIAGAPNQRGRNRQNDLVIEAVN